MELIDYRESNSQMHKEIQYNDANTNYQESVQNSSQKISIPPIEHQGRHGEGALANRAQSTTALPAVKTRNNKLHTTSTPAIKTIARKFSPPKSSKILADAHVDDSIRAALRSSGGGSRGASRGGSRGGIMDPGVFACDALVPTAGSKNKMKNNAYSFKPGSAEHHLHELTTLQESRSDLELKLEQYISHTFHRILERKAKLAAKLSGKGNGNKANMNNTNSLFGSTGSQQAEDPVTVTASQILSDTAHDPSGLTGLGLHYFTESDRFQCMCLFMSDPNVFIMIVEELYARQLQMQQQTYQA